MTDRPKSTKGNKQDPKKGATYSDYQEWFASTPARKLVLDNIKKSGLPLELRARKVLHDQGFHVSSARYFEPSAAEAKVSGISPEGLWRELDIWAHRAGKTTGKIAGCEVNVYTNIIAECKYSSDKDILVFEHLDPANADVSRFPLLANGHYILTTKPARHFNLPVLAERVIAVRADSPSKEKDNYSDRMIHDACEQIISALRHFLTEQRDSTRHDYIALAQKSIIFQKWEELLKSGQVPYESHGSEAKVPKYYINKFLKENFKSSTLADFPFVPIDLYFPLLIMDDSRGIIKVKLDGAYNPIDLEDIGLCLYLYISENANQYEVVLDNAFALPILICSLSSLHMIVKSIDEGIDKLKQQVAELIAADPSSVVREILFNDRVIGIR
ncbi:MAG: hypothetical protein NTW48_06560 [Chloroflexi bacterium]|nr:hypothetical protein [Chloroflexota bacterium]